MASDDRDSQPTDLPTAGLLLWVVVCFSALPFCLAGIVADRMSGSHSAPAVTRNSQSRIYTPEIRPHRCCFDSGVPDDYQIEL